MASTINLPFLNTNENRLISSIQHIYKIEEEIHIQFYCHKIRLEDILTKLKLEFQPIRTIIKPDFIFIIYYKDGFKKYMLFLLHQHSNICFFCKSGKYLLLLLLLIDFYNRQLFIIRTRSNPKKGV